MLQRRKRYKNRAILGYKTLAEGVINMSQVNIAIIVMFAPKFTYYLCKNSCLLADEDIEEIYIGRFLGEDDFGIHLPFHLDT